MELMDMTTDAVVLQVTPQLTKTDIRHGFTTRLGGVSEGIFASLDLAPNRGDDPAKVRENYRRVCRALGVRMEGMVFPARCTGTVCALSPPVTRARAWTGRWTTRPTPWSPTCPG